MCATQLIGFDNVHGVVLENTRNKNAFETVIISLSPLILVRNPDPLPNGTGKQATPLEKAKKGAKHKFIIFMQVY